MYHEASLFYCTQTRPSCHVTFRGGHPPPIYPCSFFLTRHYSPDHSRGNCINGPKPDRRVQCICHRSAIKSLSDESKCIIQHIVMQLRKSTVIARIQMELTEFRFNRGL